MVPEGWKARLAEEVGLEENNKTGVEKSNRMKRVKTPRNMCIEEESTRPGQCNKNENVPKGWRDLP